MNEEERVLIHTVRRQRSMWLGTCLEELKICRNLC